MIMLSVRFHIFVFLYSTFTSAQPNVSGIINEVVPERAQNAPGVTLYCIFIVFMKLFRFEC